MDWKKRLKQVVEEKSTPSVVADSLDIKRTTMSSWLTGPSQNIHGGEMLRICNFLEINPNWLMFGAGDKWQIKQKVIPGLNMESTFAVTSSYGKGRFSNYKLENDNSWEPRINQDDILFIDQSQTELENAVLYLFFIEPTKSYMMRRYYYSWQVSMYGLVDGRADDEHPETMQLYPEQEFKEQLNQLQVVGRVVGRYTDRL